MPNQKPEDPPERFRRLMASEAGTQADSPPEQDVSSGTTRPRRIRRPALDQNGMPLPNRVEELDLGATRVSRAAYEHTPGPTLRRPRASRKPPARRGDQWQKTSSCLLRVFIVSVFLVVALALFLVSVGIYEYFSIAASLPEVDDLRQRASQFETTRILDREGTVLYEIMDPTAGRRTFIPLDRISPFLVAATISTEDKDYYSHGGFDPMAILRAFWQNLTSGETVSGASTITQQLARALLFTPEERGQRTYLRKVREAILASEIERRYSKEDILELYLNEIYYGNLAYGVEAAAETYFGKTADQLTLAEAAFLAGLPQAPSIYDIYSDPDTTLSRDQSVVMGMLTLSLERNCIYISNSPEPVCVDGEAAAEAIRAMQEYAFSPSVADMQYPHWVQYIRTLLEQRFDPQTIYRSGFTVFTSLDPNLQDAAQQSVTAQVGALADKHVTGGALVAIRPSTGEILAMVGSPDFYNESAAGQINMAVSPTRQPGSSIKPFTYLAAFEKGWTPATLIWDVPSEFPPSGLENDPNPVYAPTDYDHKYRGPVTVRTALANSLNIPAVKTLYYVGVYDDPSTPQKDGLIEMAERLGITSLTRDDYGLALTLGGGDVSLLEMTGGYAVIANAGYRLAPVAILKIEDYQGNIVFENQPSAGELVLRPEHTYLISSILSDNSARALIFGSNSILNLPFQVAVKTGTSNDSRDNWTIGYTPDLAVGVWVGNPDYSPMENTTGITGAGPIWAEFMTYAANHLTGNHPSAFIRPDGVVQNTICTTSGTQPSRWCPSQRQEYFAFDQPPLPAEKDLWTEVQLDTWTGLGSSPECADYVMPRVLLYLDDIWAARWIANTEQGQQWVHAIGFSQRTPFLPERQCKASDPRPRLEIISLEDGQTITQASLDVSILADATGGFRSWRLEWGLGSDPGSWTILVPDVSTPVSAPTKVFTWDLSSLPAGQVTLRLFMQGDSGNAQKRLHLFLNVVTPTASPTVLSTDTATPTPTSTLTPTPTDTATETPADTPTPSETPAP